MAYACICHFFVVPLQPQILLPIISMRPSIIPNAGYVPNHNIGTGASYPTIHLVDLENKSLSVEESEQKISQMIHDFYHPKA